MLMVMNIMGLVVAIDYGKMSWGLGNRDIKYIHWYMCLTQTAIRQWRWLANIGEY